MEQDLETHQGKAKSAEQYEQLLTKEMARQHGYLGKHEFDFVKVKLLQI